MGAETEARDHAGRTAGGRAERWRRRGNAAAGIVVGVLAAGLLWLVLWVCFRLMVR